VYYEKPRYLVSTKHVHDRIVDTLTTVAQGQVRHFVPNDYYFGKIPFRQMPYSEDIYQDSLFHRTKNNFLKKIFS
jgi:hypothetical protein